MISVWKTRAILLSGLGTFAISACRGSEPVSFSGCFEHQGKKLVLRQGLLTIEGADAGRFQHIRSDATKGPDRIDVDASPELLRTIGVDGRYFWLVTSNGMRLPIGNGDYETAPSCRV